MNIRFLNGKIFLLFSFCALIFPLFAQVQISGKVLDEKNKEPVSFAHVTVKNSSSGTTTDIDGVFKITVRELPVKLTFLSVGYVQKEVEITSKTNNIYLSRSEVSLGEIVVLPGENPAHKYILKAIEKKNENDPLQRLQFECNIYSKMYYTLSADKYIEIQDDTTRKYETKLIDNYHLFLIENVIKRSYKRPDKIHDYVLANRISGLKNPSFTLLSADLQPFSFYSEEVELLSKIYLNPLSKSGFNKYFYNIEDTIIYKPSDTTFVISYRPSKGKNFNALEGVLSINTKNYAIESVTAQPFNDELNMIKLNQQYIYLGEEGWFPKQLYAEVFFTGQDLMLISKSYVSDVNFSDFTKWKHKNLVLEIDPKASEMSEELLQQNRGDSLTVKDVKTYVFIDSIGDALNLDKRINNSISLIEGKWSIGPIDFMLNRLMRFNFYEGFRLGGGLMTNDKIIKGVSFGGYWAYGFKDKRQKFGFISETRLNKSRTAKLTLSYINDVIEPGRDERYFFKEDYADRVGTRNFLASQMDRIEQYKAETEFRVLGKIRSRIFVSSFEKTFQNGYEFLITEQERIRIFTSFRTLETGIDLRYAPREKLIQSFGRILPYTDGGVLVNVNYTRGHKLFSHDFEYNKILATVKLPINLHFLGKASLVLQGGYVDEHIPASEMFFAAGTYSKKIRYVVNNTFQTMFLYEFITNRYAAAFLSHHLGTIYTKDIQFRPSFYFTNAAMIGDFSKLEAHSNLIFKIPNQPYLETGLIIQDIYRIEYVNVGYVGFGGGVFYRYGPNALPSTKENLVFKLATSFSL